MVNSKGWKAKICFGVVAGALLLPTIPRMYVGFKNEALHRRAPSLTSDNARELFEEEKQRLDLGDVKVRLSLENLDYNLGAQGRTVKNGKDDYTVILYQPYKFDTIAHELFHVREYVDGKIEFTGNINFFDSGCEMRATDYAEKRLDQYLGESK